MEVKICEECGVHNDINNYECESCGYDLTYTFATDLSKVDKEDNYDEEEVRDIPATVCMPKEKTLVNTNDGHSIVVPINGGTIGRDGNIAKEYFKGNIYVSSNHLNNGYKGGNIVVTDLNSTNGTKKNGFKISPGVETVLLEEDKLTIADLEFIIES